MTRRVALKGGRQHTGDPQTDEIWTLLDSIVDYLQTSPISAGRLITEEAGALRGSGLSFTSGVTRSIAHKLGRRARGFFEVYGPDLPSAAHVGLRTMAHTGNVTSDTHVTVRAASTGTCFLWVF